MNGNGLLRVQLVYSGWFCLICSLWLCGKNQRALINKALVWSVPRARTANTALKTSCAFSFLINKRFACFSLYIDRIRLPFGIIPHLHAGFQAPDALLQSQMLRKYSSIHGFPLLPARLRHWETVSFYLLLVVCLVSYTSSCLTCCSAYCSFYYSIKNV